MALTRLQFTFKTDDGIAANFVTNTLYADVVTENETTWNQILVAWTTALAEIDQLLGSSLALSGHEAKFYRMSDPEPRSPVYESQFGLLTTGTTQMATEVAVCLSFQGSKVSGLPQARRRGRIYFGPLANTAAGSDGRLTNANALLFADAGQSFLDSSVANANWDWAVYSPTNGTAIDVVDGWVDNEFDTQRRRGRIATQRWTFS